MSKHTPAQIDAAFQAANAYATSTDKSAPSLSNSDKLKFYALFKQATVGPCTGKHISNKIIIFIRIREHFLLPIR